MNQLFRIKTVFLTITVSAAVAGCSAAVDDQSSGVEPEDGTVAAAASQGDASDVSAPVESAKDCLNSRNDRVPASSGGNILISNGNYGTWASCMDLCPAGSYAYMINLKSEAPQGTGDDTSVNAISLWCFNKTTGAFTEHVESGQQSWGTWLAATNCEGNGNAPTNFSNPIVGGNLRLEGVRGAPDDTSANGLKYTCKDARTSELTATANTGWGSFQGLKNCPMGSAVCGIRTRVEVSQGSGDDTALNGVEFACCYF
jgi:hypothetical protein